MHLSATSFVSLSPQAQPSLPDSWSLWREALKAHTVLEITQSRLQKPSSTEQSDSPGRGAGGNPIDVFQIKKHILG